MKEKVFTFNAKYGEVEKYNSNFHKVKIYVAYAGKNRNGSIISRETFDNMIPSIYGIPIIGEYRDEKFNGHGGEVTINDDGAEFTDTTKAFGYIDSSSQVGWQDVEDQDGVVREYLTVEGFLWTERYPESLDALDGEHNQSMELTVNAGDFVEHEDGEYFEIVDAEFLALCILSPDTEPAFEGASIGQFGLDQKKFRAEFSEMVTSLKQSFNPTKEEATIFKGGEILDKEKVLKNEEDVVVDVDIDVEGSEGALEEATKAVELAEESESQENVDSARELVNALDDSEEKEALLVRLNTVQEELDTEETPEEPTKEEAEVEELEADIEVDVEVEDEDTDYKEMYLALKEDYDALLLENQELQSELEELQGFKSEKEEEARLAEETEIRQEKLDYIEDNYAEIDSEVKELFKDKVDEYDNVEDIDADLCVYIVKNKVNFSKIKDKKESGIKVDVDDTKVIKKSNLYGTLFSEIK